MGQVRDLIGAKGTTAAGVVRPPEYSGIEEGAVEDQLRASLEKIEQANLTLGPIELVFILDRHPRHPSALGGQCITGAGKGLLLHKHLLPRSLPLLRRHDRWFLHRGLTFRLIRIFIFACHIISPFSMWLGAMVYVYR
jgi:hypothetical protein